TVDLSAVSAPAGVTTSCAPTSISGSQTSTCTFTGTNAGSYAVTITGTGGALVHTAPVAVTITAAGPTARFVYSPTVPSVNDRITFDASSTTDSDPSATLQARRDGHDRRSVRDQRLAHRRESVHGRAGDALDRGDQLIRRHPERQDLEPGRGEPMGSVPARSLARHDHDAACDDPAQRGRERATRVRHRGPRRIERCPRRGELRPVGGELRLGVRDRDGPWSA